VTLDELNEVNHESKFASNYIYDEELLAQLSSITVQETDDGEPKCINPQGIATLFFEIFNNL